MEHAGISYRHLKLSVRVGQNTNVMLILSVANNIQPQWLSPMLLSQLPIKHLLEQARSRRREFRGLYAPLLQLINTHLPHLCLVDDWLRQEEVFTAPHLSAASPLLHVQCSPPHLKEGILETLKLIWLIPLTIRTILNSWSATRAMTTIFLVIQYKKSGR